MRNGLIDRLTDPKKVGIHGELLSMPEKSMQSNYRTILLNLIGYMVGFMLMENRFYDWIGCFLWYVLLPIIFNIAAVCLFRAFTHFTADRDSEYYGSFRYIIPGALIYSFTYTYIVIIYRSIPEAWIIMFMPVILACYFKGKRWFHVQTIIQGIWLIVLLWLEVVDTPFYFMDPTPLEKGAFFAMIMLQFSHAIYGGDTLKRSVYANMSAEEARMEVQRVFETNLSDDCKPYLDSIDSAAREIYERDEEKEVHEYAGRLIKAGEALREAIGED